MELEDTSTGIANLDNLLGGLQRGDNLVWETEAGMYRIFIKDLRF